MYKIFIADDEAIIREGIKCLLDYESLGFTVTGEASNGKKAYQGILDQKPDVVFLDIRMPEMSGLEVIREAKANGFSGKIIILSGYSDFKYAQEAIRYGVEYYLTKPIDEEELEEILFHTKRQLDETLVTENAREHYRQKARDAILHDLLSGKADVSSFDPKELLLQADIYQVIIYETYSRNASGINYRFSDLLRVVNQDNSSYDSITHEGQEVVLLKGQFAIRKFNEFLERYEQEKRPQKASPLDSLFIAYGKLVSSISEIKDSYQQAAELSHRRFFCDQGQHTIGYMELPVEQNLPFLLNDGLRDSYGGKLFDYLQAFNRNMIAETLNDLHVQHGGFHTGDPSVSHGSVFADQGAHQPSLQRCEYSFSKQCPDHKIHRRLLLSL